MSGRKSIEVTLAPDVWAYLKQSEINASGLVESAVRDSVTEERIRDAARETEGVDYAHEPLFQCDTEGCKRFWTVETPNCGRICDECETKAEMLEFNEATALERGESDD